MTTDAHVDDSPDTTTDVSATTVDGATTSSTGATVTDAGTAGDPEIGTGAQYETGAEPDGSPETVGDTETADAPKKVKKKSGAAKKQKAKSGSGKSGGEKSGSAKSGGKSSVVEKPSARAQVVEYLNPRRHPAVTVLSAVCVAALIAVAVLATLLAQRSTDLTAERRLTADKQTAETVAGNYAVGAATFDFNDLKPWSAALKKGTAAELNSRFDVAVNTLTPLIQEVQWVQTAKLIAAKTVDIRADRQFVVQVFVSTHMTSTQNPKGLNTVTPYTITLDRDSNWLITDVAGIAGAAQDGSSGNGTPNLTPNDGGSGAAQTGAGEGAAGSGGVQPNGGQSSGGGGAPAQPTP
ncbi:serine/threonine protein kinase [Gordonia otitidis]|uniref:serine/threonine protein kinase n=1 Tax=Gordonia otitidis TaxID=249058 RepID=UPI0023520BBA|nr:serine/threonine protein kinase [Gordonia otitidis]